MMGSAGGILRYISADAKLPEFRKNIGSLFFENAEKYGGKPAFAERRQGKYRYWTWTQLVSDIGSAASFYLRHDLSPGDRVAFISANSYDRLVGEMAAMSLGLVSVPIFAGYPLELLRELVEFSKSKALLSDDRARIVELGALGALGGTGPEKMFLLNEARENLASDRVKALALDVKPSSVAVMMYTSGTSGFPKGVELTHANLMSQQKALEMLWAPRPGMRFLCYLPWHHSFGGLFERFFALSSGGCLAIDDSWGKNLDRLLENFSEIRPHIYFSVPKVYQEIIARALASRDAERIFFHPELEYVFTAAAPLPTSTSDIFKAKNIPVVEGWGLTETSPCCTLTKKSVDRQAGVVGFPIPGVEIRLGDEDEILVRGPNVMVGYFRQPEATATVLDRDGWFRTGDVGGITEAGLKILTRKDRMFKLNNGEKVFPAVIEEDLKTTCKFIKYAYVFGTGEATPFALIFPSFDFFLAQGASLDKSGCEYPTCLRSFSACLSRCLRRLHDRGKVKFEAIRTALIIDRELTIEDSELTPSFKLIPAKIQYRYAAYIDAMRERRLHELPPDAYLVDIVDVRAEEKN